MGTLQMRITPPSTLDAVQGGVAEVLYNPVFRRPVGNKCTVHYGPAIQLELIGDGGTPTRLVSAQLVVKEKANGSFEFRLETAEAAAPRCLLKASPVGSTDSVATAGK